MKNLIFGLVILLSGRAHAWGVYHETSNLGVRDGSHMELYFNAQIEQELKRIFAVDSAVLESMGAEQLSDRARNLYSIFVATSHVTLRATLTENKRQVALTCSIENHELMKFHREMALYKDFCTFEGAPDLTAKMSAKLVAPVTSFRLKEVSLNGVSTSDDCQNSASLYTELEIGKALRDFLHVDHVEITGATLAGFEQDVQAKIQVAGETVGMDCRTRYASDADEYTFYDNFCRWTLPTHSKLDFSQAFGVYGRSFQLQDF